MLCNENPPDFAKEAPAESLKQDLRKTPRVKAKNVFNEGV
ncbi:hypothetical protein N748_12300 [Legionella pneumophila str. 121004]|nr:hypothetical protein N748_12300 [Legionella pneumophila str. 121004]ERH45487.1 hypothetical protein N750_01450 [Legionella pneumophila str. Leg01/53]ERI47192.1 hypothetical protein N749_02945 [Legionella pneumophila str. Leg01/20]